MLIFQVAQSICPDLNRLSVSIRRRARVKMLKMRVRIGPDGDVKSDHPIGLDCAGKAIAHRPRLADGLSEHSAALRQPVWGVPPQPRPRH